MALDDCRSAVYSATDGDDAIYDVLVVGMGPTGVTAANLLGERGVRTLVVERDVDVFPSPRAISADEDALRAWQSLGLFDAIARDLDQSVVVHYSDGQEVFFSFELSSRGNQGLPGSAFFYQPHVESILRGHLAKLPQVDIQDGREVVAIDDDGDTVTVTVRDVATEELRAVKARYVLACDGGSSAVRKMLGMTFDGHSLVEPWLAVQAKATYDRPTNGPVDFIFMASPERVGIDCQAPMGHHRWEFRLQDGDDLEAASRPENIARLLRQCGQDPDDVSVLQARVYTFHVRTAKQWKKGRVFLCGDAAHIMPPFAGQGMSSGIRDAANVAWKLAEVVHGRAQPSLLETYDAERRPHVEAMTRMTLNLSRMINIRTRRIAKARNTLLRASSRLPVVSSWLFHQRWKPQMKLTEGFLATSKSWRSPAGRPMWQEVVSTADGGTHLLDDTLGRGFAILGFNLRPEAVLSPSVSAAWRAIGATFLVVRPATLARERLSINEIRDDTGHLERFFVRHNSRVLVVRPDRIVFGCERDELIPEHYPTVAQVVPARVVLHDDLKARNTPLVSDGAL